MPAQPHIARATDGVSIAYEVHGNGATALVFVHGWCCDRHHWDRQADYFASRYTVALIDLPGHGASGRERSDWTIRTFAQDVVSVIEQLGLKQVVLVGHSLGGLIVVEAARHLPDVVIGVVGVDAWYNIELVRTPEQIATAMIPLRTDFAPTVQGMARRLFVPTSDPALVESVAAGMAAAPPDIAIAAFEDFLGSQPNLRAGLQELTIPKIAINCDRRQILDAETAQRYGIDVILMPGLGHFVMLEDPPAFNRLLDEAIKHLNYLP